MDPYWLFLKTVVSTMISLMGAAAVLFTSGPAPEVDKPARPHVALAAMPGASAAVPFCDEPSPAAAQQDDKTRTQVVDALVGALNDTDAGVRKHAVIALGEIGDARAVGGLIAALEDKDREVRRAAATSLGELDDQRAIEPLTRAMKDEDPEVRRRAVIAIAELSDDHGAAFKRDWRRLGPPTPSPTPTPRPNPNPKPNPQPRPAGASS